MNGVAQIMAGAAQGGAELFFERLCIALHRAGETVHPILRNRPHPMARLRAAGLAPRPARFGGMLDWSAPLRLRRMLQAVMPRVVVAWMGRAASMAPRGPWVLAGRLGGYYDLQRYRRCSHLIGNTDDLVRWIIRQGWPERQVHHLPNFVPDLQTALPDRMGAPAGMKLVAAAGRLHRNKGFDLLIRAMARLPGVVLVIAGEGSERTALERLARREGVADRVHLPGWIACTAPLLAACDVAVCPSRHEPLGNVVLEAWSAARPLVAAAAAGPRELMQSGQDGLIVPIEDAAALAGGIGTMLEQPALAAQLAAAGRARWAATFAEAPVVARWQGLLRSLEPV